MAANKATKSLPGAVGIGSGGGIIRLDDVTNTQGRTVPDATPKNSGVMTKTQASQLAALVAGGGGGGGSSFKVVSVIANYNAAYNDLVDGNPAAGAFAVTLPSAAAATSANNAVIVKNESTAPHSIAVTPAGGDTIDQAAAGFVSLEAGQCVYLISDSVSNWIVVSSRDFVIANYFPGVDIGAKINAACLSLPNGGTVRVLDGDYVQTTKVVVEAGITLQFGAGTISNAFVEVAFGPFAWSLKDGASMIGAPGWSTKLMTPICSINNATAVSDFNSVPNNDVVGNSNLVIKDIQFINNPASTTVAESACIQLGNITNALVEHCFFNGCEGYGVYQASSSSSGNSAKGFQIVNCTFQNIQTQHCGAINCDDFQIRDNIFYPTNAATNYTIIDCESNRGTDVLTRFRISGNIFDFRTSAVFNPGALIQIIGGGLAKYGVICENVCVGGNGATVFITGGIVVVNSEFVTVSDNTMHSCNTSVAIISSNHCMVMDNVCGTSGNNEAYSILLESSSDNLIANNRCVEISGTLNFSVPSIGEAAGPCDFNTFIGNWLSLNPYVAPPPSTTRYCRIDIVGAHSVVYNNILGQAPTAVDAPLIATIAELRALDPPGTRAAGRPAVVLLGGYTAQGDGGFSVWVYDPTSAAIDNGITVVVPHFVTTPPGTGAWLRAPDQIKLTTVQRNALVLTPQDAGLTIYNTTDKITNTWTGTEWVAGVTGLHIDADNMIITGGTNPVSIGPTLGTLIGFGNAGLDPTPGDGVMNVGTIGRRFANVLAWWHDTKLGAQLAAAASILPTSGLHHVLGATIIDTIDPTNVSAGENVTLTLIADGGTITLSAAGNIATAFTIAQNKAAILVWDSAATKWHVVQGG